MIERCFPMSRLKNSLSLKKRIFVFFFGVLILIASVYTFTFSRFITRFTEERLDTDYENIVSETCDAVENALWNLTLTSQQILENEEIQKTAASYQNSPNLYAKKDNYTLLLDTVSSLTMSNTDIGLIYLYDTSEQDFIYSSLPVTGTAESEPVLYQNTVFCFRGPCKSQSDFFGNPVLILNRTEDIPGGSPVTLSVESGIYTLERPFSAAAQKSAYLMFTDNENKLLYSTLPEEQDSEALLKELLGGSAREYRSFSKESSQGWGVHIVIPAFIYTRDYRSALQAFILQTVLLAVLVGVFALYFWKTIYKPLQLFDRQLSCLLSDEIPAEQMHSSIPEYDNLLNKILVLQKQIQEMLKRAVLQEKRHSRMQLEKLRAQINPHFLMNTLNTLHWMALMNHQTDIDNITQALSHLLSYNLDKQSHSTNLGNELNALKEYVTLQKVRYLFDFKIVSPQEAASLMYPCPKFILQPLIENALSHGYREHMDITLTVKTDGQMVELTVKDTGTGIQPDMLKKLQCLSPIENTASATGIVPDTDKVQFGIGLQYVIQSLNDFYKGDYKFEIGSIPDEGTVITLKIPKIKGGGYYAENTDY